MVAPDEQMAANSWRMDAHRVAVHGRNVDAQLCGGASAVGVAGAELGAVFLLCMAGVFAVDLLAGAPISFRARTLATQFTGARAGGFDFPVVATGRRHSGIAAFWLSADGRTEYLCGDISGLSAAEFPH